MKKQDFKSLEKIVRKFKGASVMVVGDLILDEFIWGDVSRISPEAPVPVVWVKKESFMPGGASNVANNISALGGKVYSVGVIGDDERGAILKDCLRQKGIDTSGVLVDGTRPTTLKTRVVAGHHPNMAGVWPVTQDCPVPKVPHAGRCPSADKARQAQTDSACN